MSRYCVARCFCAAIAIVCTFSGEPLPLLAQAPATLPPGQEIDFEVQVAPILEQHCLACHSSGIAKGGLSLATRQATLDSGHVVAGEADASYLLEVIVSQDGQPPEMPHEGQPLTEPQVQVLRTWIAQGAVWPSDRILREPSQADASFWSLQAIKESRPPEVTFQGRRLSASPSDSIDRFILARLQQENLQLNPPADRATLIRRATFDLTGLPPTPNQIKAFVADPSPDAYEQLIDRLLASPAYGQRWGRHWLDVVRFGESNGFERNVIIDNLWPFRDYVIQSLNSDRPINDMIREHLAGDVIAENDPAKEVGVAFLVAGPYDDVGNQDAAQQAQIRADTIDEMIRSTSEAFLGLTVGCARCHDHKFDPILQNDYYSMYATFAAVRHGSRELASAQEKQNLADARSALSTSLAQMHSELAKGNAIFNAEYQCVPPLDAPPAPLDVALSRRREDAQAALLKLESGIAAIGRQLDALPPLPEVFVGTRDLTGAPDTFHTFIGGSPQRLGPEIQVQSLHVLQGSAAAFQLPTSASERQRRLALADWIVSENNPLTARVLANRLWHFHFGTGIVDTPSDFGYGGGRPTHPELLDWLAQQLYENQWRLKPLHKTIMLSQVYRQASDFVPAAAAKDADARWLWRFPPRRLSAEEIRDSMLMVAGKLDTTMGGPGFRLYQFTQDNVCTYTPLDHHGPETYRRSVYHQNARASVVDLMNEFDQPDCAFSTPRRSQTTTPLQALTLLNHQFTSDMAQALAERVRAQAADDWAENADHPSDADPATLPEQIESLFWLCYGRAPSLQESTRCQELAQQHGVPALCRVLFNTSEMIYVR